MQNRRGLIFIAIALLLGGGLGALQAAAVSTDAGRGAVVAVDGLATAGGCEIVLAADLVVDATGRSARTPAFLEALEIEPDPNMVNHPRTSCYVRTDDFDEEAAKWFERQAAETAAE